MSETLQREVMPESIFGEPIDDVEELCPGLCDRISEQIRRANGQGDYVLLKTPDDIRLAVREGRACVQGIRRDGSGNVTFAYYGQISPLLEYRGRELVEFGALIRDEVYDPRQDLEDRGEGYTARQFVRQSIGAFRRPNRSIIATCRAWESFYALLGAMFPVNRRMNRRINWATCDQGCLCGPAGPDEQPALRGIGDDVDCGAMCNTVTGIPLHILRPSSPEGQQERPEICALFADDPERLQDFDGELDVVYPTAVALRTAHGMEV